MTQKLDFKHKISNTFS